MIEHALVKVPYKFSQLYLKVETTLKSESILEHFPFKNIINNLCCIGFSKT
jgi:hypothetical protein